MNREHSYLIKIVEVHGTTVHSFTASNIPSLLQLLCVHELTAEHLERATHIEITEQFGPPGP
jgi:hypothetical protein